MLLRLSFDTQSTVDIQLFLPEVVHIISLLLGVGSLLMRQTAYGITMNTLQSLIAIPPSGDMDPAMLQDLLRQLQQPKLIRSFGLAPSSQALALSGLGEKELEESLLDSVEEMACFLCEMLAASAVSMGMYCDNFVSTADDGSRLHQFLESSMDQSGSCDVLPAQSSNPTSSVYRPRSPDLR